MHIVICDDDRGFLKEIGEYCNSFCNEGDFVKLYADPKQLLNVLTMEYPTVDLFILDIEMPDLNGIELKTQITNIYLDTNIIFLTEHREWMEEAFGKNVIGFLSKENYKKKFFGFLQQIKNSMRQEKVIKVTVNGEEKSFPENQIIKIQAQHIYSVITMATFYNQDKQILETRDELYRMSLGKWQELLSEVSFYRVNRSLIVNLKYVKRVTDDVLLETGERIIVPAKKRKAVKAAYNEFCLKMARPVC